MSDKLRASPEDVNAMAEVLQLEGVIPEIIAESKEESTEMIDRMLSFVLGCCIGYYAETGCCRHGKVDGNRGGN